MKELQKRIEECLARLKELPALICKEREKMNGKAAIEELKERQKATELEYRCEADEIFIVDKETGKKKKTYPNDKARDYYVMTACKEDPDYQQVADEIKRFEHQRNTASMNHEALVKEHSGLISTVDVLRTMFQGDQWGKEVLQLRLSNLTRLRVNYEVAKLEAKLTDQTEKEFVQEAKDELERMEASNEGR